jgi:rhamnosyltransferase
MDQRQPRVSIIMRSYNDIDTIKQTMAALRTQTFQDFDLWNHDSSSCDGTLAVLIERNDQRRILVNDPYHYIPGKILNKAVEMCSGEIIVFLNSDATPINDYWLENLLKPFDESKNIAAVYGRQVVRKNCRTLFQKDTERAFGDGREAAGWVHFFSMANSAARRDVLLEHRFSEDIQFSEDIEWSLRVKEAGHDIRYVEQSAATHSHNYTLFQSYRRHFGEGKAEAEIFVDGEINFGFLRYVLMPFVREVIRDIAWSTRRISLDGLIHSVPLRSAQKIGRWNGMRAGMAR